MDELLASPLAEAAGPHRVALDGQVAILTLLRGVHDPAAIDAALAGIPGVRYFDNESFVRALYARHRSRSIELVGIGTAAVIVLLLLRYRNAGRAIAAGAPGILGALAAIGVIAAAGTPLNIMHLLGLVLILSLGADYGIFLVESDRDDPEDAASLLSVSLAALTTLFSFGLLSLSSFPALRSLGVATGIGVAVSPALSLCFRILRARGAPPETKEPA
jgi:predicted exporter